MDENVAGLLCYSLGWVTGLIFYLVDKRPSVRFHAAQSIVVFGGLHIIYYILVRIFFSDFLVGGFGLAVMLLDGIRLLSTVLWIVLMVKAYSRREIQSAGRGGAQRIISPRADRAEALEPTQPMGYIEKNLITGEQVAYRSGLHWIVLVRSMVVATVLAVLGFVMLFNASHVEGPQYQQIIYGAGTLAILLGAINLLRAFIRRSGAEFAVTNKRVIFKTGVVRRR